MKRLITTADDFGLNASVNEAVIRGYQDGILRYASLMVDAPAAEAAVSLAKANPGLGVGLHLELCASHEPAAAGLRYFFSPAARRSIEPETRRQIEKMLSWGLKPTHIDGHCNIHVHPAIFPVLAGLAREYRIPRLRLPGGEGIAVVSYEKKHAAARLAVAGVFRLLGDALRPYASGVTVPERTWGLLRSGMLTEDYLLWLLRRLPDGLTEIYCHPTADGGSKVTDAPRPGHHTVSELEALLSPRVREALRTERIRLQGEPAAPSLLC